MKILATLIGILLVLGAAGIFYLGLIDEYVRPAIIFYSPLSDNAVGTPGRAPTHLTTKSTYKRGEIVEARVNYEKTRDLVAEVHWNITNLLVRSYPSKPGSLAACGHCVKVIQVEQVPLDAQAGKHRFTGLATYQINFLKSKSYPISTNEFEVVR